MVIGDTKMDEKDKLDEDLEQMSYFSYNDYKKPLLFSILATIIIFVYLIKTKTPKRMLEITRFTSFIAIPFEIICICFLLNMRETFFKLFKFANVPAFYFGWLNFNNIVNCSAMLFTTVISILSLILNLKHLVANYIILCFLMNFIVYSLFTVLKFYKAELLLIRLSEGKY